MLGVRTAPLGQGAETTSVPYELGIRVDHAMTVDKGRVTSCSASGAICATCPAS